MCMKKALGFEYCLPGNTANPKAGNKDYHFNIKKNK